MSGNCHSPVKDKSQVNICNLKCENVCQSYVKKNGITFDNVQVTCGIFFLFKFDIQRSDHMQKYQLSDFTNRTCFVLVEQKHHRFIRTR